MIRITAILLIILLAACANRADWIAQWNSRCESYGFSPGTDASAQCILGLNFHDAQPGGTAIPTAHIANV